VEKEENRFVRPFRKVLKPKEQYAKALTRGRRSKRGIGIKGEVGPSESQT
jgi:hypothetical protein